MSVLLPGETPRPGAATPPGQDYLRVLARQLYQEVEAIRGETTRYAAFRQVMVASRDPANKTCQVELDGDSANPARARPLGNIVPIVGQLGWAIQTGRTNSDLMLVGMQGVGSPKARLVSNNTSSAVTGEIDWDFAANTVAYDTEWDGTTGLYNAAGGNLVARWPGVYAFGLHGFVEPSADNVEPVARLQELGGGPYYDAWQDRSRGTAGMHFTLANEKFFDVGEGIQLRVASSNGSSVFGNAGAPNEIGMVMWMSYKP